MILYRVCWLPGAGMPKFDLVFDPPVMNAAGMLGFVPNERSGIDLSSMGAFITNPLSLEPRVPAHGTRTLSYPGGILLHTGYPNPGLRSALRRYGAQWGRLSLPVIVHLLPQNTHEITVMLALLEGRPNIAGVEIGCPADIPIDAVGLFAQAAQGELPFILRLPLERAVELTGFLSDSGVAAISLGPSRGAIFTPHGKPVHGRLYGPAIFPMMLEILIRLSGRNIPLIAGGGIYSLDQIKVALSAGAVAVQLDTLLWRQVVHYPDQF